MIRESAFKCSDSIKWDNSVERSACINFNSPNSNRSKGIPFTSLRTPQDPSGGGEASSCENTSTREKKEEAVGGTFRLGESVLFRELSQVYANWLSKAYESPAHVGGDPGVKLQTEIPTAVFTSFMQPRSVSTTFHINSKDSRHIAFFLRPIFPFTRSWTIFTVKE